MIHVSAIRTSDDRYDIGQMSVDDKDCICILYNTEYADELKSRPSWFKRNNNSDIIHN
jgi:hypothetical protein